MAQGYDLDVRDVPVDAARGTSDENLAATARVAAAALGAPLGVAWLAGTKTLGLSGPYGSPDVGPDPGSAAWERFFSRLTERAPRPVAVPDLAQHVIDAGTHDLDLRGLVAFAGGPLRDDVGAVIGWVGVFDTVRRDWTQGDRTLVEGLVGLSRSGSAGRDHRSLPDVATARDASTVHELARVADALAHSLTAANDGMAGLVSQAAGQDDPTLRRHAAVADRHLNVLRAHATRLRSGLAGHGSAAAAASLFDVGVVVQTAVSEAATALEVAEPRCTIPDIPLSVSGSPVAVKRALVQMLTGLLIVAPPDVVSLRMHSRATASERLEGTLTAELQITVRGMRLTVAEISRAVAGALRADCGLVGDAAAVRMSVAGPEISLDSPGLRARTSDTGTTLALRWPVDLG